MVFATSLICVQVVNEQVNNKKGSANGKASTDMVAQRAHVVLGISHLHFHQVLECGFQPVFSEGVDDRLECFQAGFSRAVGDGVDTLGADPVRPFAERVGADADLLEVVFEGDFEVDWGHGVIDNLSLLKVEYRSDSANPTV
jgi:hypothetical protein